jgi:NADH-quinone oxidoreductase subunit N
MNASHVFAMLPQSTLALAPIVVMLAIAYKRNQRVCLGLSVALLTFALWAVGRNAGSGVHQITPLLVVDNFTLFYTGLAILSGISVIVLGAPYISRREAHPEEYYILILTAVAGASAMAGATHFASFYLALEILTVSQYGLIGYLRKDKRGTEAAIKYLILAAASAAFLLMGMALVYAELGTMQFTEMAKLVPSTQANLVISLGLALMAVGIGFKLSLAPFHLWTPDVYEGAPAPVTAFIATAGKTAMLALLVRFFVIEQALVSPSLLTFLSIVAVISMVVGNLLALKQTNIKRMLAYSSVAHMGYVATAFVALGPAASEAVAFYAVSYTAAGLAAWGVIIALSARVDAGQDVERIEDYRGLFHTQPLLGAVLALAMLSLAGIPLTGGFMGKLMVVSAGAQGPHAWLLVVLALTSAMGVYYYLRVAVLILSPGKKPTERPVVLSELAIVALITLTLCSIVPGFLPGPLMNMIQHLYIAQ